jgi:hypothetical protein
MTTTIIEVNYGKVWDERKFGRARSGRRRSAHQVFSNIPHFSNVLQHTQSSHSALAKLSPSFLEGILRPIHFFSLFFTDEVLEELSRNTNANAATGSN